MRIAQKGFTLIELLVVIAIIGILAAMLFPVFARARESARKIQCLSNVKNVALAIQMYLTDYDKTPPAEHRAEVTAYWDSAPGKQDPKDECGEAESSNPFLQFPVIFDEYIKNRDIWQCPSAEMSDDASVIVPDYYPGGEFGYWQHWESLWNSGSGPGGGPCNGAYPPGWGGTVTDSMLQEMQGGEGVGVFRLAITVNPKRDLSTGQISDPAAYVACGDSGGNTNMLDGALLAYPDVCILACASPVCWQADWDNCSWTRDCGAHIEYKTTPELRKRFARHLGGSNIGFMDGHAKWISAEGILAQSPRAACGCWGGGTVERGLLGLDLNFPTRAGGKPEWGVAEGTWPGCAEQVPLY